MKKVFLFIAIVGLCCFSTNRTTASTEKETTVVEQNMALLQLIVETRKEAGEVGPAGCHDIDCDSSGECTMWYWVNGVNVWVRGPSYCPEDPQPLPQEGFEDEC